ncbi:PLP-dependent aminotransferase family protein [Pseudomonas sp. BIGb0427]|uniref:MocR-like pyridoxine biosynthesis transcription factor PdxR n=1 Tax=unclassified Pseudomonas TaxID=196821 RepID=UPI0016ACAAFE|nr:MULTISPECIES: PLP-dependent aminotransferase family protein [unclassified Pseudomonas]NLU60623.1 PLP-dependent aminotransferase family protein [Pseudomonas sp. BIGb0427]QPG62445.1 PLP-dependent aminotransferase family protein [Pseudomonas sp. BIGb0427]UVM64789.1 PLP-dependent aminotransferase family protein [Pseudomonas sp. B21-009]
MRTGKAAIALDLPLPTALAQGKQQGAYAALRDAILDKRLAAGSRLPSTRTLAERWQLSRGTLELVFERLRDEGYVNRVAGSGTRVCAVVPDAFIAAGSEPAAAPACQPLSAPSTASGAGVQVGVPFVARLADPALFPLKAWSQALAKALATAPAALLSSPDAAGLPALREQIADYLRRYRGIRCTAQDLIVTSGIRQCIDLLARSVIRPGDKACVEDPGYRTARSLFARAGAQVVAVPVTAEGIDAQALERHLDARLACVTPAHQSPLGVTLSVSRRLMLLDWAKRAEAWIVEDDYDSEFNYNNAPLPALKALDHGDRVIYCGSFNKTLFAGLRVGFMLVPASLRAPLLSTLQGTGGAVGVTEQLGLAEYLANGSFVRYLRQARQAYQQRRDLLLACLAEHAPGRYEVSGQQAGLHFVLWLPAGADEQDFCQRAADQGLQLQPIGSFCQQVQLRPAVMIGFTALSDAQLRFAGRKLAALLYEVS